jgi:hypothetical protein
MANFLYPNGIGVGRLRGVRKTGDSPGVSWSFDFPYSFISSPKTENWNEISVIQRTSNFNIESPTLKNIKTVFGFVPDWVFDFAGLLMGVDVYENFAMAYNSQNTYDLFLTPAIDETTYVDVPVILTSNILSIIRGIGTKPAGAHGLKVSFMAVDMVPSINIRRVIDPGVAVISAHDSFVVI